MEWMNICRAAVDTEKEQTYGHGWGEGRRGVTCTQKEPDSLAEGAVEGGRQAPQS